MYEKQKLERKEERAKYREKVNNFTIIDYLQLLLIYLIILQYKLEPTPEPSDEDEDDEEEEEEDDDLFGGGGKGEGDPAASMIINRNILMYIMSISLEAKALAEKQMKDAMAMAQGKCNIS